MSDEACSSRLEERVCQRQKECSSFSVHCGHCGHLDVSWPFYQRGKQLIGPCLCDGFEWEEEENGFLRGHMLFLRCVSAVSPMACV